MLNDRKIGLFGTTRRAVEAFLRSELGAASMDMHTHAEWTLQGLGMLRTYLGADKSMRLHVWDERYKFPLVSEMHTHPWHLTSLIVAGEVEQYRYYEPDTPDDSYDAYMRQTLHCGTGGGLVGGPERIALERGVKESYGQGDTYSQTAEEIHVSMPRDGTVTLITREFLEDTEHAHVFWPEGQEWITAEPRPATTGEVADILGLSLDRWFQPA